MFIVFEGCDGSGKTTQAKLLYDYLISAGHRVLLTREPGGTLLAEKIRELVLNNEMSVVSQLYMFMAARHDHVEKIIKPFLKSGGIVICDRFIQSSMAYQKSENVSCDDILGIYKRGFKEDALYPHLTTLLAISPRVCFERLKNRKMGKGKGKDESREEKDDVFEEKGIAFHNKVFNNYLESTKYFQNTILIKTGTRDEIFEIIKKKVMDIIKNGELATLPTLDSANSAQLNNLSMYS